MRKIINISVIISIVMLLVSSVGAEEYKYKYIYKNGKKYKVKVVPKYKYIYRNGKKYKVLRKPADKTTSKYGAKENTPEKKEGDSKLFGMTGSYFYGVNLVTTQKKDDYTISAANSDNNYTMVFKDTGDIFYTDGRTYNFSKTESVTGLDLKGGFESNEGSQVYLNGYLSSDLLDFGITYQYGFTSLRFSDITPYIDGKISFGYNDFSSITGFIPNAYAYGFGFGGNYGFSKNIDLNFGLNMMTRNWTKKEDSYATETRETKDTNIYFGFNYYFR